MAGNDKKVLATGEEPVVSVGESRGLSLSMDEDGNPEVNEELESGHSITEEEEEEEGGGDAEAGDETGEEDGDGKGDGADPGDGDGGDDLGDYAPERAEEFHAVYRNEEGNLNLEALSKEWWENPGKDGEEGSLKESTYAYLEDTLGMARADIKSIEAAIRGQTKGAADAALEQVGGAAVVKEAIAWGKAGGYTPEQRKRFNAIMSGKDSEAQMEALEAVVSRFQRSKGTTTMKKNSAPADSERRKNARVAADAAAGAGSSGKNKEEATGYKDMDEYREALRAARRMKNGKEKDKALAATRRGLAALTARLKKKR